MFCEECNNLIDGKWVECWRDTLYGHPVDADYLNGHYHHDTLRDLRECADKQACRICQLVARESREIDDDRAALPLLFNLLAPSSSSPPYSVTLTFQIVEQGMAQNPIAWVRLFPQDLELNTPGLEPSTDSPSSLEFMRRRFEDCLKLHSACRRFVSVGYTPSRLLDVGKHLGDSVRVVEKQDVVGSGYATLSHCWGDGNIPRLMADNEHELRGGIKVTDLPLTFADAVRVCRHLDIRHLWIDSLCIKQDSAEDWAVESSRMKDTYMSAALNIAASSATNSHGGLFFDRDPDIVGPFPVRVGAPWGARRVYNSRKYDNADDGVLPADTYLCASQHKWVAVDELPLNQRGWVMQERLLSNRTLHFTSTEIFWQCRSQLSSESVSDLYSTGFHAEDESAGSGHMMLRGVLEDMQQHGVNPCRLRNLAAAWSRFVKRYSTCGLSHESDKLVALCGIFEEVEKVVGDECMAGHWKRQLPNSLCWVVFPQIPVPFPEQLPLPHRNKVPPGRRRSHEWRAPSWSWASMNSGVSPYMEKEERLFILAELLEVSVRRKINGSLTSAKLRIRGALFGANSESSTGDGMHDPEVFLVGGAYKTHSWRIFMDEDEVVPSKFFVFPVMAQRSAAKYWYCLMLLPTDSHGVFRRIGVLREPFLSHKVRHDGRVNTVELVVEMMQTWEQPKGVAISCGSWNETVIEIV